MPSLPPIRPEEEAAAARVTARGAFDEDSELAPDPLEDAYYDYLLRLADDSLILGQRLSEWCGHAPSVEVDLSLANMALDLIGQATHIYEKANNGDGDELAFKRDVLDFRNCLLVEQPNGDFAQTIARQFLFSTFQHLLFGDEHLLLELVERPAGQHQPRDFLPVDAEVALTVDRLRALGHVSHGSFPRPPR